MIIFYHKTTGEIIGTIDGRVHFDHHLNAGVSRHDIAGNDIKRIVIGYVDDLKGNRKEYNMDLWKYQLTFENPKHSDNARTTKVKVDKNGKALDIIKNKK